MTYPVYNPPRPTAYDEAVLQAAVKAFVEQNLPQLDNGLDAGSTAQDLLSVALDNPYRDGYQFAKALEDDCGWDCDFNTADTLESLGTQIDKALNRAVRKWSETNGITPPLAVGERVICRHGGEKHGVITGLSAYRHACYEIRIDGFDDNQRAVVAFEDARKETL